jgi:hypothetical protein
VTYLLLYICQLQGEVTFKAEPGDPSKRSNAQQLSSCLEETGTE